MIDHVWVVRHSNSYENGSLLIDICRNKDVAVVSAEEYIKNKYGNMKIVDDYDEFICYQQNSNFVTIERMAVK
jgi:hypothetical protein